MLEKSLEDLLHMVRGLVAKLAKVENDVQQRQLVAIRHKNGEVFGKIALFHIPRQGELIRVEGYSLLPSTVLSVNHYVDTKTGHSEITVTVS